MQRGRAAAVTCAVGAVGSELQGCKNDTWSVYDVKSIRVTARRSGLADGARKGGSTHSSEGNKTGQFLPWYSRTVSGNWMMGKEHSRVWNKNRTRRHDRLTDRKQ